MPPLIRVANESNPASVAGAMAGIIRDYGFAEAQSVGAAAGNQMLKAAAIAKSYLVADRLALSITPDFVTVRIGGFPRSAIHLFIRARPTEMDNRMDWTEVPAPAPTKDD
ncbi:MAG: stage V sporulation protein S [Caldilineaceae bacterium]|nr:stage V sporulation protein S [Caldilineaceae bacterium]